MTEVTEYTITTESYGVIKYLPNPQHRDKNPKKSQWLVSIENERYIFECVTYYKWVSTNQGWGLFIDNNNNKKPSYLGVLPSSRNVFIAKFVVDENHNSWHGYPADHISKVQDIPNTAILQKWVKDKLISKPKMRKILQGKPCNI